MRKICKILQKLKKLGAHIIANILGAPLLMSVQGVPLFTGTTRKSSMGAQEGTST